MIEDNLRDGVSEVTEIPEGTFDGHLLASVGWGTLVGTVSLLGMSLSEIWPVVSAAFIAGVVLITVLSVSFATLLGMISIGLPCTFILAKMRAENAGIYALLGAVMGCLTLLVIVDFKAPAQPEEFGIFLIFALTAGACAYRWGIWREALVRSINAAPSKEASAQRKTNPIHDLTH